MLRNLEWLSGLAAGILSVPFWVYAALTTTETVGDQSVLIALGASARGAAPLFAMFVSVACATLVVAALGAHLHARGGRRVGLVLVWAGVALCLLAVAFTGFPVVSSGAVPILLAIVAAVAGTLAGERYRVVTAV